MMRTGIRALAAVAASFGLLADAAHGESNYVTGTTNLSATAHLDFRVVVPRVLFLQVGTGTSLATNATVDLLTFTVPGANIGDGTVIAGTGGDLSNGTVTAKVISNGGAVSLTSTTAGALGNGTTGQTISFTEFTVAAATNTSTTALAHPAFVDGGTTATPVAVAATNGVAFQDAKWTFTYKNATSHAAGTYGGANTNNGRVTYTATSP